MRSSVHNFHGIWYSKYFSFMNGYCTQRPVKSEDTDNYIVIDTQSQNPKVRIGAIKGTLWYIHPTTSLSQWADTTYEEIEDGVLASSSFLDHHPSDAIVELYHPFLKFIPPSGRYKIPSIIVSCDYGFKYGTPSRYLSYILLNGGPQLLEKLSSNIDAPSKNYLLPSSFYPNHSGDTLMLNRKDPRGLMALFEYIVNRLYCFIATNMYENKDVLPTYQEAAEIYRQYTSEQGRTIKTPISRIWKTRNGSNCTEVFTFHFPYAPAGSTIWFENLPANWSQLNQKEFKNAVSILHFADTPFPSPQHIYTPMRWSKIVMPLDTTNLEDLDARKQGKQNFGMLCVNHKVSANMEYPEFIAAMLAIQYEIYRMSQHTAYGAWTYKNRPFLPNTWSDLQEALHNDEVKPSIHRWRSNRVVPTHMYHNPVIQCDSGLCGDGIDALLNPICNPYCHLNDPVLPIEELGLGKHLDYNIVQKNYLNDKIYRLYWRIKGKCLLPFHSQLTTMGYSSNGSEFEGRADLKNPGMEWSILGVNDDSEEDDYEKLDSKYGDRSAINPKLSKLMDRLDISHITDKYHQGKTIGYMRISSYDFSDPLLLMTDLRMGNRDLRYDQSSRMGTENFCGIFAELMRELLDPRHNDGFPIQDVILDIRCNSGGLAHSPWIASFFGDNRSGSDGALAVHNPKHPSEVGEGAHHSKLWTDILKERNASSYRGIVEAMDKMASTIDVRESLRRYGSECVFQNGNLYILTDECSCSEGDETIHYFLGDNLDRNIGANTHVFLVGEISGRIIGGTFCNITPDGLPLTSQFLTNRFGKPVNCVPLSRIENSSAAIVSILGRPLSVQDQTTALDILIPNISENVWQDIGFDS